MTLPLNHNASYLRLAAQQLHGERRAQSGEHMTDAEARAAIAAGYAVTYSTARGWHYCVPSRAAMVR